MADLHGVGLEIRVARMGHADSYILAPAVSFLA